MLLPSLIPFYFPSSSYFCFKFYFISSYNLFLFSNLSISPHSKTFFLSLVISHFFPVLKYLYSLSTLIELCLLVLDTVIVVAFLQFYFYISIIFVFSNLKFYHSHLLLNFPFLLPFQYFCFKFQFFPVLAWFSFLTHSIPSLSVIPKSVPFPLDIS